MAIRIVRLGSSRESGEGTRLGTVRHTPRGVRRENYAKKNYFDVWVPELAPSPRLVAWARAGRLTDQRWATFSRSLVASTSTWTILTPLRRKSPAPEAK